MGGQYLNSAPQFLYLSLSYRQWQQDLAQNHRDLLHPLFEGRQQRATPFHQSLRSCYQLLLLLFELRSLLLELLVLDFPYCLLCTIAASLLLIFRLFF